MIEVGPGNAGLHLVGWLPEGTDDREASRRAAARGVETAPLAAYGIEAVLRPGLLLGYAAVSEEETAPLAAYGIEAVLRPGLLLGYAAVSEEEIREGARRLAEALG